MREGQAGTRGEALKKLQEAARGQRVLVVLDDAWAVEHEKALNPVDQRDTHSRLLVSTRIRRLFGGRRCAEVDVGLLTRDEAVDLLLETAELEVRQQGDMSDVPKQAVEIVDLCGRLPLTVAIAGGVVRNYGGVDDRLVQILRKDKLRGEADGVTVEERIIEASLRSLGPDRGEVERVFFFLAVLPEDASLPAALFEACALAARRGETPSVEHRGAVPEAASSTGESAASVPSADLDQALLAFRTGLTRLVRLSFLKGSIQEGLMLHDLVRDYLRSRHTAAELRLRQLSFVEALLEARGVCGGFFVDPERAFAGSLDSYCAQYLSWHMREAVARPEDAEGWMRHDKDPLARAAAAKAVGAEAVEQLAVFRNDRDKDPRAAAELRLLGSCFFSYESDKSYRWLVRSWELFHKAVQEAGGDEQVLPADAAGLAEAALDQVPRLAPSAVPLHLLEAWVLANGVQSWSLPRIAELMGGETVARLTKRQQELLPRVSRFHALVQQGMETAAKALEAMGMFKGARGESPNPSDAHIAEALELYRQAAQAFIGAEARAEVSGLVASQVFARNQAVLFSSWILPRAGPQHGLIGIEETLGGEVKLLESVEMYRYERDHAVFTKSLGGFDNFLSGFQGSVLLLRYANLRAAEAHVAKCKTGYEHLEVRPRLEALREKEAAAAAAEFPDSMSILHCTTMSLVPALALCGCWRPARELLKAMGMWTWHPDQPRVIVEVLHGLGMFHWFGEPAPAPWCSDGFVALQRLEVLTTALGGALWVGEEASVPEDEAAEADAGECSLREAGVGLADAEAWLRGALDTLGRAGRAYAFRVFLCDMIGLGARVFERLGKAAEAKQLAEANVAHSPKSTGCFQARTVLGRLAASRGEAEVAEEHLEAACAAARNGGYFGLELLGLQLLRTRVLVPKGREAEGTRRLEEAARERLGNKSLGEFRELLERG